jgi:hypothetical protein
MEKYGNIIDSNPINDKIYEVIQSYYNNPVMTKIKDVNNYSVYMAKIKCILANENRYIVAIIYKDSEPIHTTYPLSDLFWVSFQCRSLPENHTIETFLHTPRRGGLFSSPIIVSKRNDDNTTYTCSDFPTITLTVLHKKGDTYIYQEKSILASALETYKTILTIKDA